MRATSISVTSQARNPGTHVPCVTLFASYLPHVIPSMVKKMKTCIDLICVIQCVFSLPKATTKPHSTRKTQKPGVVAHVHRFSTQRLRQEDQLSLLKRKGRGERREWSALSHAYIWKRLRMSTRLQRQFQVGNDPFIVHSINEQLMSTNTLVSASSHDSLVEKRSTSKRPGKNLQTGPYDKCQHGEAQML